MVGSHAGPPAHDGRRWSRWSLRRTVTGLIVLVGVVTLAINSLSILSAVQTRHMVAHQQQAIEPAALDADSLLMAVLDQEAGERGFVITGDPAALGPYTTGTATVENAIAQLRRDLRGDGADLRQVTAVQNLDRTWVTTVASPEIADIRSGDTAAPAALERSGAGQTLLAQISQHMTTLTAGLDNRRLTVSQSVLDAASRTIVLDLIRSWFLLAILVGLWLLLNRLVSDPVEQLDADVRMVAEGDVDRPITAHGLREFATLGRSTESMRRALRDDSDELRQLRQALAQRSPLHGLLRSELQSTEDQLDASIAGRLLPADGVLAGDWYDAWNIGDQRIALALVDVSGHGPQAGIMALRIKHLLGPPFRMGMAPGAILDWVVDQLPELDDQCVSAIVLDLDLAGGRCRFANAGHPSGLLFGRHGIRTLDRTGPLICGLPGRTWATREVAVDDGDLVVLVTDGLIEARLPDGSEFGVDRIRRIVEDLGRSASPATIAEGLVAAVREACVTPLRDDATVVVARLDLAAGAN